MCGRIFSLPRIEEGEKSIFMDENEVLHSHLWSDGAAAHQVQQDGQTILHHRCIRCGRDFAQGLDQTYGWQAAHVGLLRIELLARCVSERWLGEPCPGQIPPGDDIDRSTRRS